jgi:hypothetical protein
MTVADTPGGRLPQARRKALVWWLWFAVRVFLAPPVNGRFGPADRSG